MTAITRTFRERRNSISGEDLVACPKPVNAIEMLELDGKRDTHDQYNHHPSTYHAHSYTQQCMKLTETHSFFLIFFCSMVWFFCSCF